MQTITFSNTGDTLTLLVSSTSYGRIWKKIPVNFERNLTRKITILSIVGPRQVREDGDFFKSI